MAQFRATMQGNRGGASRLGTKKSGLDVTANAWHVGIDVMGRHEEDGRDSMGVYLTGGSSARSNYIDLGCYTAQDIDQEERRTVIKKHVLALHKELAKLKK